MVQQWRHVPGGSAGVEETPVLAIGVVGVDGAGVGGTCLAAVLERKEKAPALAIGAVCVDGAGVRGTCLAAVLEKKKRQH